MNRWTWLKKSSSWQWTAKIRGILAVDLAGNEADFPGEEFAPIFREAQQAGMKISIHAENGAARNGSPWRSKPSGLSGSVMACGYWKTNRVTAQMKERQIAFEVCPTSNHQSGVVSEIDTTPAAEDDRSRITDHSQHR